MNMNRRELIKSLALMVLAGGTPIIFGEQAEAASVAPHDAFPLLSVGKSFRYDSGLKVTFLAVRNDSRCPINANCVSAGDAKIRLRVRVGTKPAEIVTLHTNDSPRSIVIKAPSNGSGIPKSYIIRVTELTPGRVVGKTIPQSDYRVRLRISLAV